MKYDTVIIGGGMAGLLSAIELAEKGKRAAVVSKGDPVCSISTGCIDLSSDYEAMPDNHPYKKAGKEKVESSIQRFMSIMKEAGLPYHGEVFTNRNILTPVARKRETCLVPTSMAEAHNAEEASLHIISFKGIKDFFPGYFGNGHSIYDSHVKTTIGIATRFDDPNERENFITWLKALNIQEEMIAMPAVLGTENPESFLQDIEKATGKKVFEIPTLPPSIPGLRLFRALKRRARTLGVDFFWGHAISSFEAKEGQIEKLIIEQPGRPIIIEGKSFILATGSFVSGGLFAEKASVRETVFGLTVSIPENEQRLNDSFFDPHHPINQAGISVEKDYKVADSPFTNIFAAGSILQNALIMKYNCGHGMAIVTALEAAKSCEEFLK